MTFSLSIFLSLFLFFLRVFSLRALTLQSLSASFSLFPLRPLTLTNNEHWILETENMSQPEGGIAARGSVDDYEVINLVSSSRTVGGPLHCITLTAEKTMPACASRCTQTCSPFVFINWEIGTNALLKRYSTPFLLFILFRASKASLFIIKGILSDRIIDITG